MNESVVCVENTGEHDLVRGKRYRRLPSTALEEEAKLLRVIDESGEDYLYPADCFRAV